MEIPHTRPRGTARSAKISCQCGAELHTLAPGETLARTGQPRNLTCPECSKVHRLRVVGK